MNLNVLKWASLVFVVAAVGCGSANNTTQPSAPTAVPHAATSAEQSTTRTLSPESVTMTSPQPVTPNDGQSFKYAEQPLTLVVKNAATAGSTALTYTFQIASDATFGAIVYSKTGLAAGSGGQTSVTVDTLVGSKTYFWRSQAVGAGAGPFSKVRTFTVGPQVVLGTPSLAAPTPNSTVGQVPLVVNNVTRSGPAGPITYRFDLADSSSFDHIVFTATVAEQSGLQTSVAVTGKLSSGTTYFWRVQAVDALNAVTTAFSTTFSFQFVAFDMTQAIIRDNPPDMGTWPETATITFIQFRSDALIVDFDKRTGPGRWPNLPFRPGDPANGGGIQYTLGMCFNLGGQWNCSAPIQFWQDRELEAAAAPSSIPQTWYYDGRWGPMAGYLPAQGEMVGIFVALGNVRSIHDSSLFLARERSNVALVPFDRGDGTVFTFATGRQPFSVLKRAKSK
jgi:hypothetical protein